MISLDGFRQRIALAMAGKSPWGGKSDNDGEGGDGPRADKPDSDKGGGPRNPWLPGGGKGSGSNGGGDDGKPRRSANIEDIFKHRGPEGPRRRGGGPGGPNFRLPPRPGGKSWLPIGILAIAGVWLFATSYHQIGPKEGGIVTTFGSFSRTLEPGPNLTAPFPIQSVEVIQTTEIRQDRMPEGQEQKLILTGDQNLVDLSYLVRWNVKNLEQFKFQLAEPETTIQEVAEAAMRASVAEKTLDDTISGSGRADIEQRVRARMQALLDAYKSGVAVQGVEIDKTDPPAEVNEAFKDVLVAEQDANAAVNRARGFAQQVLERAQGDTGAFDRVYEEYRRAPQVTRQRLYYETMERVLSQTDKTIIETDGVTPYLPLPEIRRRAQQSPSAPAAAPQQEGQ